MKSDHVERLKKFKEASGWSYQKISNLMGVHAQTLIFWLNGTYSPSPHFRKKINEFLETYSYKTD